MKIWYLKIPIELFQKGKEIGITNTNTILVYCLILNNHFQFNLMTWKNETIAKFLNLNEKQVKRALTELKQNNWIRVSNNIELNNTKVKRDIQPIYSTLKYSHVYKPKDNDGFKIQYITLQIEALKLFGKLDFEYDKSLLLWSRLDNIQSTPYLNKYTIAKCAEEFSVSLITCKRCFKELQEKNWLQKQNGKWITTDIFTLYGYN